ncbi:hypothetical protein MKX03_014918 [Papaver bracteatum]|nr:hypothetical protein MKX03_014918 [Papaver bracteatum]
MMLITSALQKLFVEEMHRNLCGLVIQFIPLTKPPQLPGSVFRTFLQDLLLNNRSADRNPSPHVVSSNSVLVSMYTVILHILSEGLSMGDTCGWTREAEKKFGAHVGFLHKGGHQSFPISLFLKSDPHRIDISRLGGSFDHLIKSHSVTDEEEVIQWEDDCMDDEETRVTHSTRQKPCCCSSSDGDFSKTCKDPIRSAAKGSRGHCSTIPERSAHFATECSSESLNDDLVDKPTTGHQSESEYGYPPMQQLRSVEEELFDGLLLRYHLGLAPNFKQASYYTSHQSQSISLLEETDKQMRERSCGEQLKRLKEARNVYREELIDCGRHCAWYRISVFSLETKRNVCIVSHRQQGQSLVGIILKLLDADTNADHVETNSVVSVVDCGFQYLLDFNWAGFLRAGDTSIVRLEDFLCLLRSKPEATEVSGGQDDADDSECCICYASKADAQFEPCSHKSCFGCITGTF